MSKSDSSKELVISEILSRLEEFAPSGTAEKWDNVGLLVGDRSWKTAGAVISDDLTPEALETARREGWGLILTHHPCLFPKGQSLSRIIFSEGGRGMTDLVAEALRHRIAIIACHTNFDQGVLEVARRVSQGLGFEARGRLFNASETSLLKLSVYVPNDHVDAVRTAICEAGAGHIGDYDFCTFGTPGQGTFRGGGSTNPFLGKAGRLERAEETRLETVLPRGLQKRVLRALFHSHPYEEVAYDLFPVVQAPSHRGLIRGLGYGVWGEFRESVPFSELAQRVIKLFKTDGYRCSEPVPAQVRRMAFTPGQGASFVRAALSHGCDLLITGEVGYHDALEASRGGMTVIELGHRESEYFFLEVMEEWLGGLGLEAASLNLPTQRFHTTNSGGPHR